MHMDLVTVLGLALADDGQRHVNLELLGDNANGGRGQDRQDQGGLHGGGSGGVGTDAYSTSGMETGREGQWKNWKVGVEDVEKHESGGL